MSVNDPVKDAVKGAVKLHAEQGERAATAVNQKVLTRIKVRKVGLFGKCRGSIDTLCIR